MKIKIWFQFYSHVYKRYLKILSGNTEKSQPHWNMEYLKMEVSGHVDPYFSSLALSKSFEIMDWMREPTSLFDCASKANAVDNILYSELRHFEGRFLCHCNCHLQNLCLRWSLDWNINIEWQETAPFLTPWWTLDTGRHCVISVLHDHAVTIKVF